MFALTPEGRIALVRKSVCVVEGRVPAAATGNFGANPKEQFAARAKIFDAGADVVVVRVPDVETNDNELADYYLAFQRVPHPIRRLLPPELTRRLAESER